MQSTFAKQAHRIGKYLMFLHQHFRSQRFRCVVVINLNRRLRNDRPRVEQWRHEMHRASVQLHALGQCAFMRINSGETGQ